MTKQEFATLVVAMQAMYGKDFIGTEQALDVWYALLHDLDYQILSKVLQQYMLTNKFKPTVAELREIYTELVSPSISDWSEGWEKVSKAIGYCIDKLESLSNSPVEQVAIIKQTIQNGWTDFFPVKEKKEKEKKSGSNVSSWLEREKIQSTGGVFGD